VANCGTKIVIPHQLFSHVIGSFIFNNVQEAKKRVLQILAASDQGLRYLSHINPLFANGVTIVKKSTEFLALSISFK